MPDRLTATEAPYTIGVPPFRPGDNPDFGGGFDGAGDAVFFGIREGSTVDVAFTAGFIDVFTGTDGFLSALFAVDTFAFGAAIEDEEDFGLSPTDDDGGDEPLGG